MCAGDYRFAPAHTLFSGASLFRLSVDHELLPLDCQTQRIVADLAIHYELFLKYHYFRNLAVAIGEYGVKCQVFVSIGG